MVFFVCEGCNETLKKNKVTIHAGQCRNCWAVSCVDCSVVFKGDDYAAHTSCISEAEKYEKSCFQGKKNSKTLQERWMDIVQTATCLEDRKIQDVLTRIASYDNVPRKKNKFVNFVSNSLMLRDAALVKKVWIVYEMAYKASASGNTDQNIVMEEKSSNKRVSETPSNSLRKTKTKKEDQPIKWSKLVKSAMKRFGKEEMEMEMLWDCVLKEIRESQLSMKNDKELKKEFTALIEKRDRKYTVIQVVRLLK